MCHIALLDGRFVGVHAQEVLHASLDVVLDDVILQVGQRDGAQHHGAQTLVRLPVCQTTFVSLSTRKIVHFFDGKQLHLGTMAQKNPV